MSFFIIYTIVDVECTQYNHLDDAILMSTQNIFFMIKYVPQISPNICVLELLEEFPRDAK